MSAHVRRQGNWEIRTYNEHDVVQKRWIACPLCGYEFDPKEKRSEHIAKFHGPQDAGLSPLSNDHDGPSSIASFEGGAE